MDAAEHVQLRRRRVRDPDAGHDRGDVILAYPCGLGSTGIRRVVVGARELDGLVAHSGQERPSRDANRVLREERERARTADAIRLASGRAGARETHEPVQHLKPVFVLEPILLVLVEAESDFEVVLGRTGTRVESGDGLDALRIVLAGVGADSEIVRIAVGAFRNRQLRRVFERVIEDAPDTGTENALELVPVALEVVAIERGGDVDAVGNGEEVLNLKLLVIPLNVVGLGCCVATYGVIFEVGHG